MLRDARGITRPAQPFEALAKNGRKVGETGRHPQGLALIGSRALSGHGVKVETKTGKGDRLKTRSNPEWPADFHRDDLPQRVFHSCERRSERTCWT